MLKRLRERRKKLRAIRTLYYALYGWRLEDIQWLYKNDDLLEYMIEQRDEYLAQGNVIQLSHYRSR